MDKAWVRAAFFGMAVASTAPAIAADKLVDATDPEALADIFRGYGSARMDVAADGTPAIRGRIEGNAFSVYFYGCDDADKNCSSLNLTASWETKGATTLDQVNAWNQAKRFGRAYVDAQSNAVVETDINLSGGVSIPNMEGNVDWWRIIMADFKSNVVDASGDPGGGEAAAPSSEATETSQGGQGSGSGRTTPFAIPRKPN